jgi:GT2 family glycosyltransferase
VAGLSVSIVTYAPELSVLSRTLASLADAVEHARGGGLKRVRVTLVDNGPGASWRERLRELTRRDLVGLEDDAVRILTGHGNVGYGAGHNLALAASTEDYHLVLNPDVVVARDAILEALAFMESHREVGLLAPSATGVDGSPQYLCKRYPSVLDLLLRGFAPQSVRNLFATRLGRYEMRSETGAVPRLDVPIASGSFMFLRRNAAAGLGGFSESYFMYFEDYDLSLRLATVSRIAHVPAVKIVHLGGNTARKGFRHIRMFVRSGWTFFNRHGWKLW